MTHSQRSDDWPRFAPKSADPLGVTCPTCSASPGKRCLSVMSEIVGPHFERFNLANPLDAQDEEGTRDD
jgi:hypothetical protein